MEKKLGHGIVLVLMMMSLLIGTGTSRDFGSCFKKCLGVTCPSLDCYEECEKICDGHQIIDKQFNEKENHKLG